MTDAELDDDEYEKVECFVCLKSGADYASRLCADCTAERDADPVWQLIRRVERGEVTVKRREDLGDSFMLNYFLETSDGWLIEVFPDGQAFSDWDYIDGVTAPDGTKWEPWMPSDPKPAHGMPWSVWGYRPEDGAAWNLRR